MNESNNNNKCEVTFANFISWLNCYKNIGDSDTKNLISNIFKENKTNAIFNAFIKLYNDSNGIIKTDMNTIYNYYKNGNEDLEDEIAMTNVGITSIKII